MTHREAIDAIKKNFTAEQRELIALAIATAPIEPVVKSTFDQHANSVVVGVTPPTIALAAAIRPPQEKDLVTKCRACAKVIFTSTHLWEYPRGYYYLVNGPIPKSAGLVRSRQERHGWVCNQECFDSLNRRLNPVCPEPL